MVASSFYKRSKIVRDTPSHSHTTYFNERNAPMAIYHLEAKVISRGSGRSVVAASAYMSCSKILNDYDGIEHDYTKKQGLIYEEVLLPSNAPPEWKDRSILWNAVEEAEKTKDSRLAREFVVALPTALDKSEWIELLHKYIDENFVSKGMCADMAIHDTDGHNPHAHILLTVRPLNENGTWQYKTEKEYVCKKDNIEKNFTASEYADASKEGWEKLYQYKVGKKKVYMTPSEAKKNNYSRVNKYPKSSKFGRQNPISLRWNSDEQLLSWRKNWANVTNEFLESKGIDARIDHRSYKDQGIDLQPTIHEGVTARKMEKEGHIADRCEINRKIKADNKLLINLKTALNKISKSIEKSIPKVAETLENIFANITLLKYNILVISGSIAEYDATIKELKEDKQKYNDIKKEIKEKRAELKAANAELKNTPVINIIKRQALSKQIATLTEELEELKSDLSSVYMYYSDEAAFIQRIAMISEYEKAKRIQEANRNSNESKASQQADEFIKIRDSIEPVDAEAVILERQRIHKSVLYSTRDRYAKTIQDFDYSVFSKAEDITASMLNEDKNSPMCSHDALTKAKHEAHELQDQNELLKDSKEKKRNETSLS